MWSYYGSKGKIVKHYPKPKHSLIIEPFAGTAKYSLLHNSHNVLLNEKYETVYKIWKWLIEDATEEEILSNIDFFLGDNIECLNIKQEHKDLIGFIINRGSASPANIVGKWSCQVKSNPNWASTPNYSLKQISKNLKNIKHWKVNYGDYKNIPNIEATWFIDPPYKNGGQYYSINDIDYEELSKWCKSRKGQVIVCENSDADWLNFKPLLEINGQRKKTIEVIWTNE